MARDLQVLRFPRPFTLLPVGFLMLAALTTTWGAIALPVGQMTDVFLFMCLGVIAVMFCFGGLRAAVPYWLWIPPIALMLCLTVRLFLPPPYYLYILRFQASPFKPENFVKGAYWLIALVAVPLAIIACTKLESRTPRLVMGAYLGGVCVSSAIAITDVIGLTHISRILGYASINARQIGLTTHPNTLGFTCAIALPFALYFMSSSRRSWIPALSVVLLLGGVLASGSRGSQVAVPLAGVIAIFFVSNRRAVLRQLLVVLGIALAAGVLLIETLASHVLKDLFRFSGATGSASQSNEHRALLATQSLSDFQNYPFFGLGLRHITEAHNIILQMLAGGGLVLTLSMLVYWVLMLRDSWRLRTWGEPMAMALFISVVTWLILGMIENQLTDRLLYYTVGCIAALISIHLDRSRSHGCQEINKRLPGAFDVTTVHDAAAGSTRF